MFQYCKLIKDTYNPNIRPAPSVTWKWPWVGAYDTRVTPDSKMVRVGVIIQTKSESIDVARKWLNDYLIKKYKRTH